MYLLNLMKNVYKEFFKFQIGSQRAKLCNTDSDLNSD